MKRDVFKDRILENFTEKGGFRVYVEMFLEPFILNGKVNWLKFSQRLVALERMLVYQKIGVCCDPRDAQVVWSNIFFQTAGIMVACEEDMVARNTGYVAMVFDNGRDCWHDIFPISRYVFSKIEDALAVLSFWGSLNHSSNNKFITIRTAKGENTNGWMDKEKIEWSMEDLQDCSGYNWGKHKGDIVITSDFVY